MPPCVRAAPRPPSPRHARAESPRRAAPHRWDKHANKLIDSEPKVRFAQLPVLWITGTLASAGASKTAYYTCPCYKAPRRTGLNFVTSVDLRVEENPSKWVLRGVALLTSTE
jgi:dynein heavy chain